MRTLLISIVACAVILGGCYRTRVTTGKPSSGVHVVKLSHTFIGGLIGSEKPAGCDPSVVETRLGVIGLIAAVITVNLWVPLTVDVECAAGSTL